MSLTTVLPGMEVCLLGVMQELAENTWGQKKLVFNQPRRRVMQVSWEFSKAT